jgi:hypothetical protein
VLFDRAGMPLSVVSAADTNDSSALKPAVKAIPAIRFRRGHVAASLTTSTPTRPTRITHIARMGA